MSQRQRDWVHWLKQAERQAKAAERMGVSERAVGVRLLRRRKKVGDRVVVHRLRRRPSNRKLPERMRARVMRLIEREYDDFEPTLIAESLESRHGIGVGKETVRKWMIGAGVWKPKRARVARRFKSPNREQLSGDQLIELQRKLAAMAPHELATFHRVTHNACRYDMKQPSPRMIQELVQAWKQ